MMELKKGWERGRRGRVEVGSVNEWRKCSPSFLLGRNSALYGGKIDTSRGDGRDKTHSQTK